MTTEDYPGFGVHPARAAGSITVGTTGIPVWSLTADLVAGGWRAVTDACEPHGTAQSMAAAQLAAERRTVVIPVPDEMLADAMAPTGPAPAPVVYPEPVPSCEGVVFLLYDETHAYESQADLIGVYATVPAAKRAAVAHGREHRQVPESVVDVWHGDNPSYSDGKAWFWEPRSRGDDEPWWYAEYRIEEHEVQA